MVGIPVLDNINRFFVREGRFINPAGYQCIVKISYY